MEKIYGTDFYYIYNIYRNRLPSSIKNKMYSIGLDAVKQNGSALYFVPEGLRDYNMCITAVKQNSDALRNVPPELQSRIREELGL
jgi:hypothetical protein